MNAFKKKDYVKRMKPITKILYYLWVIIIMNRMPEDQTGHLIIKDPCYQVYKSSDHITYWKWNWFNPLTYICYILLILFMIIMHIFMAISEMVMSSKYFKVTIKDDTITEI